MRHHTLKRHVLTIALLASTFSLASCRSAREEPLALPHGPLTELERQIGYAHGAFWSSASELPQVRLAARHILISHRAAKVQSWLGVRLHAADRSRDAAIRRALAISEQLVRAPDRFARLAQAYSDDDASAAQEGALGVFAATNVPRPMLDALATLKIGEVSRVFETELGFQIVQRMAVPAEERVAFAHIVVAHQHSRPSAPRPYQRARDRVSQIHAELRSDPARFAEIARQTSDAADAERGGDRGSWRTYEGAAPSIVLEAVRRLKPGQVSSPIETEDGFELLQRSGSQERERYALTELAIIHADAARALPTATLSRSEALGIAQGMLSQLASGKTFLEVRDTSCKPPACLLLTRSASRGRGAPELERALLAQAPGGLVPEVIESAVGFHVARRMVEVPPEPSLPAPRFELPEPPTVDQMIARSSKEELGAATRRAGRGATEALGVKEPGVVALFDELALGFEREPAERRMMLLASARARLRSLVGDELAARIGAHVRGELNGSSAVADKGATR